jgi:hypothetical protein
LYRLKNLKLLDETEFADLQIQEEAGRGKQIAETLGLAESQEDGDGIRARIVALALEAYRREEITRRKLDELAALAGLDASALEGLLGQAALDRTAAAEVLVPPE